MPAPPGNRNSVRHGLTCGSLPKGAGYIKRISGQFRTAIERAVVDVHGEVTLYHAAIIQTAMRWERHALLAQRWLRREDAKLTVSERLGFSREVARASAERDKCLAALRLDKDRSQSVVDALYGPVRDLIEVPSDDAAEPSAESPGEPIEQPVGNGETTGDSGGESVEILTPEGGTDQ